MELSRPARRGLAVACAVAWLICPTVEPLPNGPEPTRQAWIVAVDMLAVVTIVAAVVLLWRGSRLAVRAGVLAAVAMAAETVLCPGLGHHTIGWWTWTQWAMTAFVLLASLAAGMFQREPRAEWAAIVVAPAADVVVSDRRWWRFGRPLPTHPAGVRPARGRTRDRKSVRSRP